MSGTFRWVEQLLSNHGYTRVAGVDEAGRGAIAGPVVASAVLIDINDLLPDIDDSKKLNGNRREKLHDKITTNALDYMTVIIAPQEIDRLNILKSTMIAMEGTVLGLRKKPQIVLVDGNKSPQIDYPYINIINGDNKSNAIACASILAKVTRDRIMMEFEERFPDYGFAKHKGYATGEHKEALKKLGACLIHRRTFKPVRDILDDT